MAAQILNGFCRTSRTLPLPIGSFATRRRPLLRNETFPPKPANDGIWA